MTALDPPAGHRDIAEELAAAQREISVAEFFEKNKQMLGFDSTARALVTTVKEACDNALDAAEEAGYLPDIYVEIQENRDYYTVIVEDNGPGITKDQIPKIFGKLLYGSRFHRREQSLLPDQQILIRRNDRVEFVPIGAFCDAYLPTPDGEGTVRIGDGVSAPCFDRETGDITWQPVTHAIRHKTDEEAFRIETTRGRTVEVTGNHSLFTVNSSGEVVEVAAGELEPGNPIVAPERIPSPEDVREVNILSYIPRSEVRRRRWFVYGVDTSLIERIEQEGEVIRKPTKGGRRRYFYRYNGIDILQASLKQNYLKKGYLPAELVLDLGWEDEVAGCVIRTYQVGGKPTEIPVTIPLTPEFMRFLGLFVAEGHAGERQLGLTFGSHEADLISEMGALSAGDRAVSTTTVDRKRNAARVKAFGSPLVVFVKSACGAGAEKKRVPPFVFCAPEPCRQAFLDALYQGDGSDSYAGNELSLTTTSVRLAREVSYLWAMQGVTATWRKQRTSNNITGKESVAYCVLVYGQDIDRSQVFETTETRMARYRRIPVSIFENVAFGPCKRKTVPPTPAGIFHALGLGSNLNIGRRFYKRALRATEGEIPPLDYYTKRLQEHGLLSEEREPTEKLFEVLEACERFVRFGESDLCLLTVTDVIQTPAPESVYDISVPGTGYDENFIAGNRGAIAVKNSRGQQGIGISAAVMYAQLTSGKPVVVTSRTASQAEASYFELVIDTERNEPVVQEERAASWDRPRGTRIELHLEASMRARSQLHDYIRHTAVVNPHARVELVEPESSYKAARSTDELPAETEPIRPHPHGIDLGTLLKMVEATDSYSLSGFLRNEFTRVGAKTAGEILDGFRDRHYGREVAWPTADLPRADVGRVVVEAVANKPSGATRAFADEVAAAVTGRDRVAHHELVEIIEEAADAVEADDGTRFGRTVRENTVQAVWERLTADRETVLVDVLTEATSNRKDEATIRGLAERLAAVFAEADRDRMTNVELREYVDRAADMTVKREDATVGETARDNIVTAIWGVMRTVPDELPKTREVAGDRDTAAALLGAMRAVKVMAPPTDCLAPIRADLIEEGLRKEVDAEFYGAVTRDAEVHGGDPFIVEAGVAYGGSLEDGQVDLLRFANRVPLVYQQGACAITDVIRGIDWRNYGLDQPGGSGIPAGPAVIMVHVASTNVPFTSESKDAVANIPEIEHEIELAVRDVARDLKSHLNQRRSLRKRREKQTVIAEVLPKIAEKVAVVTERDPPDVSGSLAQIMNNVLVSRAAENGRVEVTVRNYSGSSVELDVTEIVTDEPAEASEGTIVEMDGEWYIKWSPRVSAGESARLTYRVGNDALFDLHVEGVPQEKLTVFQ